MTPSEARKLVATDGLGSAILVLLRLETKAPLTVLREKKTFKNTAKKNTKKAAGKKSDWRTAKKTTNKTGKTNVRQRILEMITEGTYTREQIKLQMAEEFPNARPTYVPTLLYRARQTGANSMYGKAAEVHPTTGVYFFPEA